MKRIALILAASLAFTVSACDRSGPVAANVDEPDFPVAEGVIDRNNVAEADGTPHVMAMDPVARATSAQGLGYNVLIGAATPIHPSANTLRAAFYVRGAAKDAKEAALSCVVLDKAGSLLGTGNVAGLQPGVAGLGGLLQLNVTTVEKDSNVKCQIIEQPKGERDGPIVAGGVASSAPAGASY